MSSNKETQHAEITFKNNTFYSCFKSSGGNLWRFGWAQRVWQENK